MTHDEIGTLYQIMQSIPLDAPQHLPDAIAVVHRVLGKIAELCDVDAVFLGQTTAPSVTDQQLIVGWHRANPAPTVLETPPTLAVAVNQTRLSHPHTLHSTNTPPISELLALMQSDTVRLYPIFHTETAASLWGFFATSAPRTTHDIMLSIIARQLAALLSQAISADGRQRLERAINLINEIAPVFVREPIWEQQIHAALDILCNRLAISRAYGYLFTDRTRQQLRVGPEARRHSGLPRVVDSCLRTIPRGALPLDQVPQGVIGHPQDMPYALRDCLIEAGVCFFVAIPIELDNEWIGILALDDLEHDHPPWSDNGIEALHTVGNIMLNAYVRSQADAIRANYAKTLEERNAALQIFSALVAHDIKAPLGHISHDLDELTPTSMNLQVERIRTELQSLRDMIKRLEVLARSHAPYNPKVIEVYSAVWDAQQRLSSVIKKRNIEITMPTALPLVLGRDEWLTEVFYNLLLNAIQSFPVAHPQPCIIVSEAPTTDIKTTQIVVQDNSIGMSPERVAQLGTMFDGEHPTYDHQGLGLTLVHFLLVQMGGRVHVISKKGTGTTFWFSIPAPSRDQRATYVG